MSTRVGYRALIIDAEIWAFRLSQFLTRPEINNKIIQSVSFLDSLNDAHYYAEQADFIYLDPFAFSVADSIRFIVETLQRSPAKAFTFYRSGRQWQERGRDLDGLPMSAARLRTMLFLDKDLMGDATFGQQVRNNIMSMEREFLAELQRSGLHTDPMSRSGAWNLNDFAAPRQVPPFEYPQPAPFSPPITMTYGSGMTPQQIRDLADTVANLIGRQPTNPTHPLTPLLPAPDFSALQSQITALAAQMTQVREQQMPQVSQALGQIQGAVATLQTHEQANQQGLAKQTEALAAAARDQREAVRQMTGLEQRLRDAESRQTKSEQTLNEVRVAQQAVRYLSLTLSALLGIGLVGLLIFFLVAIHH